MLHTPIVDLVGQALDMDLTSDLQILALHLFSELGIGEIMYNSRKI